MLVKSLVTSKGEEEMKKGIIRWAYSTNAKDIGIIYIVFAVIAGLVGTSMSMVMRMELGGAGNNIIASNQTYNILITAHGFIMIFYLIMPALLGGFGNMMVPIMVGAVDMAEERKLRESYDLRIYKSIKLKSLREKEIKDYVTGLFEGDGSIWIQKEGEKKKRQNPRFKITFSRKDIQICKKLLEILGEGSGRIGYNKGGNACDLVISSIAGLKRVVGFINGRMRTPKIYRLNKLIDWLNKNHNANLEKKQKLKGGMGKDNWLGGFIDADGSFGIRYTEREGKVRKRRVECVMRIEQRKEDIKTEESYKEVMQEIAKLIGIKLRIRKQKATGREYYIVRGSSKKSIERIMNYFERYRLYTSKYMEYKDWKIVAEMILKGEHYSEEGLRIVKEIKGRMNRNRKEYNWNYLKDLKIDS